MPTGRSTAAKKSAAKVLVVDDHPVVRQGFAELIDQNHDLKVCGQAEDAASARDALRDTKPDVLVLDLSLEGASGLDFLEGLKATYPKLPVLVLSMHDESLYAERALRAGARGYIMKERPIQEVMTAIRRVLAGEVYLSDRMSARLLRRAVMGQPTTSASPVETLSNRELQVFELIGQGYETGDIAAKLHLSVKTVHTHRENIKKKLSVANGTELHQQAFMWMQREPAAGKRPIER
ncbi:MAG: response regulator transcription factor [Deltaproteobacteria bacterium]|nr:response regulator transcription factor [Deltaproteobacteria bacterium]